MANTEGEDEDLQEEVELSIGGNAKLRARPVTEASEDIMLLWGLGQPQASRQHAFVSQTAEFLRIETCGQILKMWQAPSAYNKPGVTGSVLWDSAIILGKFLEHAHDSQFINLREKRCIELGAGCGFLGCVAALLGGQIILTDLPDRLRLLQKNVSENINKKTVVCVQELTWGDEPYPSLIAEPFDYVLASDVVYNEKAVDELLNTLKWLCGKHSTVILSGELRNDAILEYFLESGLKDFNLWRIPQSQWHPDFLSTRIAIYVMKKKESLNEFRDAT